MKNHEELERDITSYLLGDLDAERAKAVEELLEESEECQALAQDLELTLGLLRDALADSPEASNELDAERRAAVLTTPDVELGSEVAPAVVPQKKRGLITRIKQYPRMAANIAALFVAAFISVGVLQMMQDERPMTSESAPISGYEYYKTGESDMEDLAATMPEESFTSNRESRRFQAGRDSKDSSTWADEEIHEEIESEFDGQDEFDGRAGGNNGAGVIAYGGVVAPEPATPSRNALGPVEIAVAEKSERIRGRMEESSADERAGSLSLPTKRPTPAKKRPAVAPAKPDPQLKPMPSASPAPASVSEPMPDLRASVVNAAPKVVMPARPVVPTTPAPTASTPDDRVEIPALVEDEPVNDIPILGDIPVAGSLFRASPDNLTRIAPQGETRAKHKEVVDEKPRALTEHFNGSLGTASEATPAPMPVERGEENISPPAVIAASIKPMSRSKSLQNKARPDANGREKDRLSRSTEHRGFGDTDDDTLFDIDKNIGDEGKRRAVVVDGGELLNQRELNRPASRESTRKLFKLEAGLKQDGLDMADPIVVDDRKLTWEEKSASAEPGEREANERLNFRPPSSTLRAAQLQQKAQELTKGNKRGGRTDEPDASYTYGRSQGQASGGALAAKEEAGPLALLGKNKSESAQPGQALSNAPGDKMKSFLHSAEGQKGYDRFAEGESRTRSSTGLIDELVKIAPLNEPAKQSGWTEEGRENAKTRMDVGARTERDETILFGSDANKEVGGFSITGEASLIAATDGPELDALRSSLTRKPAVSNETVSDTPVDVVTSDYIVTAGKTVAKHGAMKDLEQLSELEEQVAADPAGEAKYEPKAELERFRRQVADEERADVSKEMMSQVKDSWNIPLAEREGGLKKVGEKDRKTIRTEEDVALETKLASIVVPELDFRNASMGNMIEFLVATSREQDVDGDGVGIVFKGGVENKSAGGRGDADFGLGTDTDFFDDYEDFDASEDGQAAAGGGGAAPITLSLRRVTLLDALRYSTEISGTQFHIENGVVVVEQNEKAGNIVTKFLPVDAGLGIDQAQLEAAVGAMPAGASVTFESEISQVIVAGEEEFQTKVESAIEKFREAAEAPDPEQGSVYRAYSSNPYMDTVSNPFSTFAIDVDNASYTLTRSHMKRGVLPPADAVRTEEFVNFFNYHYPSPENGVFAIYNEAAPAPFGSGYLLKVGVKGKVIGRDQQRPATLTFVIDTSGSMDTPDRLGLAKQSLKLLIGHLSDQDRVAIVQYDFKARLVLGHTPASEKKTIADALDSLQISGSTNLEDGLKLGYAQAAKVFDPNGVNQVLLISDGMANLGNADAENILGEVEAYRKQGITCSIFGFGIGNYNDAMLESLANKGDGVYRFIDGMDEAKRVFVDNLSATLNYIASDVKIQVQFNPERVKRYRQIGYENRQLKAEQFRDDTVDAGEVGSGQAVTALYEFDLAGDPRQPLGMVRVRYRNMETGDVEEIEREITVSDIARDYQQADGRFKLAACVAEFAEVLRGSPFAEGADYASISKELRPVAQEYDLDQHIQELLRQVQSAAGMPRTSE